MNQITTEKILGFSIIIQTVEVCIGHICDLLKSEVGEKVFVCANPHSLIVSGTDPLFHEAIQSSDLLTPDGFGIVMASKIWGGGIRERVTGSDIFYGLSRALNEFEDKQYSYFFLGSTAETLDDIRDKMAVEYPNIKFAGSYSPPFKAEFNDEDNALMINAVNSAKPDILWVGMTAPKQEKWIHQNRTKLNVKLIGAIGAVFDFYTGKVKRSSPVFQKMGLEWLPRLMREPRRLFERNFVSTPKFILMVLAGKFIRRKKSRPFHVRKF